MPEVGTSVRRAGYVTVVKYITGKSTFELERLIGYGPGSLSRGYALGLLAERVGPADYQFRGYTHLEDGKPAGEDEDVHARLGRQFSGHPVDRAAWQALLARGAERLNQAGSDQACKVFPKSEVVHYEVGEGIVQFKLLVPKQFDIVLEVKPGQRVFRDQDGAFRVV